MIFIENRTKLNHAIVSYCSLSKISNEEILVKELIQHGEIDQVIAIYQQLKPQSVRVFCTLGKLYANEKGNYELAISYFEQALHMQEEVCRTNVFGQINRCNAYFFSNLEWRGYS